ncbi:MAG: PH domain-containing protein [Planctomycetes bacterium]|nr:PH domain-containing protein [Planctomycetota bacterium]MCB9869339.1 PH domain-containing protein [Planctomycetota bacterium]
MTSSEHEAEASDATDPVPGDQPVLLAHGYLHPGILFLRLAAALRSSVIPMVVGLFVVEGGVRWVVIGVAVFFLVMNMAYVLIRFITFRYWLTTDELVTTEGIFNRQERRIPVNRIQDLSFEQSIVRRLFGLVVVTVETAAGEGAEAKLDSLGLAPAAQLREALQYLRATGSSGRTVTAGGVAHPDPAAWSEEEVVLRVRAVDLTMRGLTDNRAGAILIFVFVLIEQAQELGVVTRAKDVVDAWVERFSQLDVAHTALVAAVALVVVVVLGWVVSIAASFLLFFGFTLTRRGEVFQRRYGLLTTRVRSLPQRKIQRVLIEQNLLRRMLRVAVVRADSAGSGANQQEEVKGGLDVVAPLTPLNTARLLVPHLLPGMDPTAVPWQRVSGKVVGRLFAEGFAGMVVVMAVGLPTIGVVALASIVLPVLMLLAGVLIYHNLGYAHADGHFAMRWGVLGRYRAFIPLRKVQAVALRASPWDRAFGLARLVVYVAGAAPTTLQHLTRSDAVRLQRELAHTAARARFVW